MGVNTAAARADRPGGLLPAERLMSRGGGYPGTPAGLLEES